VSSALILGCIGGAILAFNIGFVAGAWWKGAVGSAVARLDEQWKEWP
jgi:hypothetical protein